ncbi:hypothetical protein GGI02_001984 [Coemansia sp. RSA 2322]|nr:hypothetical protein GGI02_001984 [Coemansia sp. RSA 2322]
MSEEHAGEAGAFKIPSLPPRKAVGSAQAVPQQPLLKYQPPANAGLPKHSFSLNVIKDGSFVDSYRLPTDKTFSTFGRLPLCDFSMDHGSISRYHAVLQFTEHDPLPSIVDLGSAHGTFINKSQIQANTPLALAIGDQIRFGASSRIWIIGSTDAELLAASSSSEQKHGVDISEPIEPQMASWGMGSEEAHEGSLNSRYGNGVRPSWRASKDAEYRRDPTGYLQSFMNESGHAYNPEYQAGDTSQDQSDDDVADSNSRRRSSRLTTVRIELPFNDEVGNTLFGTAKSARRADAERLACLDALEELDRRGYLNIDSSARGKAGDRVPGGELGEDSDDDFYDQTKTLTTHGDRDNDQVETLDSLTRKMSQANKDIIRVQLEIAALPVSSSAALLSVSDDAEDELDAYMNTLACNEQADAKRRLVSELEALTTQKSRFDMLLKIIAPDYDDSRPAPVKRVQDSSKARTGDSGLNSLPTPDTVRSVSAAYSPATLRQEENKVEHVQSAKRRVIHGPTREDLEKRANVKHAKTDCGDDNSDAFVSWQPPAGQKGDGRTSLNDKYGY